MKSRTVLRSALATTLGLSSSVLLGADGLTLGTGFDYTSGKYGSSEKTEILYVPLTGRYETGPWTFRAVVPYIRITGPGNVVGAGADRVTLPGAATERRTESGLGDIVGSAFYNVLNESKSFIGLDVGAKVKFGTADRDKGLGTGKNDYSIQTDVFKPLGPVTAFASLGYRWYGDPPGVDLRNVYYGSAGATYKVSADTSAGAAYDWRPRVSPNGGQVSEATAFVTQRLSREWKVQFYGVKGFSTGSPDFGVGALLSYSLQ
jgi:hypothetical protein